MVAVFVLAFSASGHAYDEAASGAAATQAEQTPKAPAPSEGAQSPPVQPNQQKSDGLMNTLALSPAVIMARGVPGQTTTQTLTITNNTSTPFAFDMVAQDIVVREGKRVFVNAGELPHSIAATAIFSPKHLSVDPGHSGTANVTVTLTPDTEVRAIAAIFHVGAGVNSGSVGIVASLGTLITFTASNNFAVASTELKVKPQTETVPLQVSLDLTNTGTEPVIPEGVVALLNDTGKFVGKAPFVVQRLLPGEHLEFAAEYGALLKPGKYRAVASFQFEDKALSKTADFTIE
jgi:hypothetical protein